MLHEHFQVLSIDYDQLSDEFLYKLEAAKQLERLVVHLHGVRKNHPGTTNKAWDDFRQNHPTCEFRLTVIHAFKDIKSIHETVMRRFMPLSHLKVFFCESVSNAIEIFLLFIWWFSCFLFVFVVTENCRCYFL